MNKIILIVVMSLFLSGCFGLNKIKPTIVSAPVRLVHTTSYPNLPNLSKPPKMNLDFPDWEVARDMDKKMTVRRLSDCINIPEDKRNNRFWATCGEYPHTQNSNIYRGFSYDAFQEFRILMSQVRGQLELYSKRIDLINQQRKAWRDKIITQKAELNKQKAKE